MPFAGFDHIDTRVRSIAAVEPFYDCLMPLLGLPRKQEAHVDVHGEWHSLDATKSRNVVEYHEPSETGRIDSFIGFIEDPTMQPTATRIAFRLPSLADLEKLTRQLVTFGARAIEPSESADYPAVFFEDPAGTKLELCARIPRSLKTAGVGASE